MISAAMPAMVFLCSRSRKTVAEESAMLDGAGHRIGFSAGRLHAGIQAGASPCSDSRNEYKKIQLCAVESFFVSPAAFCHSEKDSREFQF